MTAATWSLVRPLLEDVLELPASQAQAYLDRHCDPELRAELDSLLAVAQREGSLLDEPGWALEMITPSGTRLGHYILGELVGRGGMGVVYRAHDERLDRSVAIKLLPFSTGGLDLLQEARTASSLSHPNIVVIHDVLEYRGAPAMVMEFVEGQTLAQALEKGRLELEPARRIAIQIAHALAASHEAGVLHRDLKPSNVIVRPDGTVKLLDFGIAVRIAGNQAIPRAGTAGYMAPEQAAGEPGDARSDIYSFGALFRAMLPSSHPARWRKLWERCLHDDPALRFTSMRQVRAELERTGFTGARWAVGAGILCLAGLAAWSGGFLAGPNRPSSQVMRFEFAPPEGGVIDQSSGALSPDGLSLAFVARVNGRRGLWVRSLVGREARLLPGTDGARQPFWSPDARHLAFLGGGQMRRVALAGGEFQVICDELETLGAFWGKDGRIIYSPVAGGLRQVPASGGTSSALTELDLSRSEIGHRAPQSLPDGRILFYAVSSVPGRSGMDVISQAHPAVRQRLMPSEAVALFSAGHLLWRRGSALVAQPADLVQLRMRGEARVVAEVANPAAASRVVLSASENQAVLVVGTVLYANRLAWFDRSGKRLNAYGEPRRNSYFALAPNGQQAAVARGTAEGSFDLWSVDLERDAWTRLTFGTGGSNNFPVWSPDGKVLIYRSGRPPNLVRRDLLAGPDSGPDGAALIVPSPNTQWPTSWSADGRTLMYYELMPGTNRDIWTIDLQPDGRPAPGAKPRAYLHSRYVEQFGRFAPGPRPRWVAYQSNESGEREIYVSSYPQPIVRLRLSTAGGARPEWSPDGRQVYFISPDNRLMTASLRFPGTGIAASAPRELFALPDDASEFTFAVSPDGQRFLFNDSAGAKQQPLEVIMNWPAKLNR